MPRKLNLVIAENLSFILNRIDEAARRAGRRAGDVRLVAVSKTVSAERVREAVRAGVCLFGENKVQEAVGKIDAVGHDGIRWHFIGHLQKNKVKFIFDRFEMVHSVDSVGLAEKIHAEAQKRNRVMPVLIEVNVSGEASKFGVSPDDLEKVLRETARLKGVAVRGLMTIPPLAESAEDARKYFVRLRGLRDTMKSLGLEGVSLDELSMGMSGDYEVAVEEGATLVRIGTALFGERRPALR